MSAGGYSTGVQVPAGGMLMAGLGGGVSAAGSALRHLAWWLEWQTRPHPTHGGRGIQDIR
jgi:hypothetical protein